MTYQTKYLRDPTSLQTRFSILKKLFSRTQGSQVHEEVIAYRFDLWTATAALRFPVASRSYRHRYKDPCANVPSPPPPPPKKKNLSSMSEGSSRSFTAQGSSSLDQSFEKDKNPVVLQQSIYDGGKTAWLTVAGTYVA